LSILGRSHEAFYQSSAWGVRCQTRTRQAGNGQSEKIDELAAKHEMIADRTELDEARKALAIDMTKRMHVVFGSRMYANPDDLGLQITRLSA
jgi:hypothetical protein